MNIYKLDRKSTDENFLGGNLIQCNAMISVQDYEAGLIKAGDKIVVMLSNGKKYMGNVVRVTVFANGSEKMEGILEIIKHEPPLSLRK
jgi:hypothetical protein